MGKSNQGIIVALVACVALLASCGTGPSDTELAAQNQVALAATVAAAGRANEQAGTAQNHAASDTTAGTAETTTATLTLLPATSSAPTSTAIPTSADTVTEAAAAASAALPSATHEAASATAYLSAAPAATQGSGPQAQQRTTTSHVAAAPTIVAPTHAPTSSSLPSPRPTTTPVPPSPVPPSPVPTDAPVAQEPDGPVTISFVDLYSGASVTGPILSDTAKRLNGHKVVMLGYMAPPLKPDLDFFVLTKDPMVYCPFCSSAADWPFDIVFVRMANGSVPPVVPTQAIRVVGTFQTGTATDAATGFVSQVRIIADTVDVLQ